MTIKRSLKWFLISGGIVLLIWLVSSVEAIQSVSSDTSEMKEVPELESSFHYEVDPYFAEVLTSWKEQGLQNATASVTIDAGYPSKVSGDEGIRTGEYQGKSNVLIWNTTGLNWVEYQLNAPNDALYEIQVSYHALKDIGGKGAIQFGVTIDGQRPYLEASSVSLYRTWEDVRPILTNSDGDEIRPRSIDVSDWKQASFIDSGGAYAQPLQWHFKKGTHTIRLEGYGPIALEHIQIVPSQSVASYSEVAAAYDHVHTEASETLVLQAEEFTSKNDTAIKLYSDKNPRTVPRYKGRTLYNTVGGLRWIEQNQEITWTIDVPETGLYKIAVRALQNTIAQKTSFRTIRIDGEVPFQELLAYSFPYSTSWKGIVLGESEHSPYLFYLEQGQHTLSMAVTHSPVKSIIIAIEDLNAHLDSIDWDLRNLTGTTTGSTKTVLDRNRTWNMEQDSPGLTDRLLVAADAMEALSSQLVKVNGNKDSISQGLDTSANDIRDLVEKPEEIPYHIDEISSMREKLGTFIDTLMKQSLQLDEIYIIPAQAKTPSMESAFLSNVKGSVQNFSYSFDTRDNLSELDTSKLNVWVQRGRDYVDQLQQLADESFTPETGIEVKVNLLPNPELLLMSNAAGVQPDIALGLTQDLPVDYAIRGSTVDLSQFDDFEELYPKFSPGSWLPLHYNGGYYGVPETQSFQVLYYRKDILQRLGVGIPNTWDDVYDLLPTLQQNFMNFYVNPKEFTYFFYQNGVEFYEANGAQTGLDKPEAYQAFKQWTDLFNTYAVEREVPSFYQHFRKGTMPVGISDYNMYVQLSAAAPELNGRWGIALIPGTKQADGTISRWAGGGQRTGVIFEKSERKDQAWQFLKWWLSTDVQVQYGSDLEAVNGVAFRWNTSNIEAFTKLPWKKDDANVILNQWKWYKDIPNVPGGYFLEREMNNAWVRSVVGTTNYMFSLEQTVRDINRELQRKQEEFGFIDSTGTRIKTLDIQVVDAQWEGIDRYVE